MDIVVFCDPNLVLAYVQPEGLRCDFYENKKLRKKIGIFCGSKGMGPYFVISLKLIVKLSPLSVIFFP